MNSSGLSIFLRINMKLVLAALALLTSSCVQNYPYAAGSDAVAFHSYHQSGSFQIKEAVLQGQIETSQPFQGTATLTLVKEDATADRLEFYISNPDETVMIYLEFLQGVFSIKPGTTLAYDAYHNSNLVGGGCVGRDIGQWDFDAPASSGKVTATRVDSRTGQFDFVVSWPSNTITYTAEGTFTVEK